MKFINSMYSFEEKIKSDLIEIPQLLNDIVYQLEEHSIGKEILFNIQLCLDEAITNIINYAYQGIDEVIDVKIIVEPNRITVELIDSSEEYNPLESPDPDTNLPLEERPIGGLGILLIKNLSDFQSYKRIDNKNCLSLFFNTNNQSTI